MRLYNDRDEVMRRLAPALESAFQVGPGQSASGAGAAESARTPNAAAGQGASSGASANVNGYRNATAADMPEQWPERAIARVNSVAPASPAADAVR